MNPSPTIICSLAHMLLGNWEFSRVAPPRPSSSRNETQNHSPNYRSFCVVGVSVRCFITSKRKHPRSAVQRGSPHRWTQNDQNEPDLACLVSVLEHLSEHRFLAHRLLVQFGATVKQMLHWLSTESTQRFTPQLRYFVTETALGPKLRNYLQFSS